MRQVFDLLNATIGATMMYLVVRHAARVFGGPRPVPARTPFDSRRVATHYRKPEVIRLLELMLP